MKKIIVSLVFLIVLGLIGGCSTGRNNNIETLNFSTNTNDKESNWCQEYITIRVKEIDEKDNIASVKIEVPNIKKAFKYAQEECKDIYFEDNTFSDQFIKSLETGMKKYRTTEKATFMVKNVNGSWKLKSEEEVYPYVDKILDDLYYEIIKQNGKIDIKYEGEKK